MRDSCLQSLKLLHAANGNILSTRRLLKSLDTRQIVVFLLVGSTFAALYAGIAALCMSYLTKDYWQASAIGYSATIIPAYIAQKNLSFRQRGSHYSALPKYIGVQISAIVLSSLISEGLGKLQFLPSFMVFLGASAITTIFTFCALRLFVFRRSEQ